jgi:uncharacterized protein YraI
VAKNAVNLVIDGLTDLDWVGIVTFGSESSAYSNYLQQATSLNRGLLKQYVEYLYTDGYTNYGAGF